MSGVKPLGRLDFDQRTSFDQQVDSKCIVKVMAFEVNWNSLLPFHRIADFYKFRRKYRLIDRFHHPRTKRLMKSHRNGENVAADLVKAPHSLDLSASLREQTINSSSALRRPRL